MKTNLLTINQDILKSVLRGEKCNIICKDIPTKRQRLITFIKYLNKLGIEYKLEENTIKVGRGFAIFTNK